MKRKQQQARMGEQSTPNMDSKQQNTKDEKLGNCDTPEIHWSEPLSAKAKELTLARATIRHRRKRQSNR